MVSKSIRKIKQPLLPVSSTPEADTVSEETPGSGSSEVNILRLASLPGYKTAADTEPQSTVESHFYTHTWHIGLSASPHHPGIHGLHRNRVLEGQRNKHYWRNCSGQSLGFLQAYVCSAVTQGVTISSYNTEGALCLG